MSLDKTLANQIIDQLDASKPVVPVKAIFSVTRLSRLLSVSPAVISNWASRYEEFPLHVAPGTYDVREVLRWLMATERMVVVDIRPDWEDI